MIKINFVFGLFFVTVLTVAQSDLEKKFISLESNYLRYAEQFPSDLNSLEVLGDLYGSYGKWEKASEIYSQLKQRDPYNANYHFKYGGVVGMMAREGSKFKALSRVNEAKKAFTKAEILDPKHWQVQWAQVELYSQLPAILGGSYEKAWVHAERLEQLSKINGYFAKAYLLDLQQSTENSKIYSLKGLSLVMKSECYNAKSEVLFSCYPHNNNLISQIAIAFEKDASNPKQAAIFFNKYIEDHTPKDRLELDQAHFRLAKLYVKMNQLNMALENLDMALKINPSFQGAKREKNLILTMKEP